MARERMWPKNTLASFYLLSVLMSLVCILQNEWKNDQ